MKIIIAGMVALGILWIIDAELNDSRYTVTIIRALRPLLTQLGIQI